MRLLSETGRTGGPPRTREATSGSNARFFSRLEAWDPARRSAPGARKWGWLQ